MATATEQGAAGLKLTMKLGSVSYSYDLYFLLALTLAVIVVFLFSMQKFAQPTASDRQGDFLTPLLPKFMTTQQEYSRALIFYVTTMIFIVVILSFLGPRVVSLGSTTVPEAPVALPLFIALVLVGVLPNVPWLQELELHLRRFAHERAFIPRAARATADKLAAADLNFTQYDTAQVLNAPGMRGVERSDFKAARGTLEYSWARVSCLLFQLRRQQDGGLDMPFDREVLERYAKDLDNLAVKRKSMEDDITRYRAEREKNAYYEDESAQRAIRQMLHQLYILLGCAVRLKLSSNFIQRFGFELPPDPAAPSNRNIMIVGLAVMTVSVFLVVYAAIGLVWFGSVEHIWRPSSLFPVQLYQPYVWAISSLLAHGTAILVADWLRRRLKTKRRWFARSSTIPRRNPANYVLVAVACAIAGLIVNYLWGLIFAGPSLRLALYASPTALLPAVTGGFYVFHLDNVELKRRPSRFIEIGMQAVVTGFCGFAATSASLGLLGIEVQVDLLLLYVVVGFVIGASLAWYVPKAADLSMHDPLTEEANFRLNVLKSEAAKLFGHDDLADQWIDEPITSLGNMSPRQGSMDIAQFEKSLAILRAQMPATQSAAGNAPN